MTTDLKIPEQAYLLATKAVEAYGLVAPTDAYDIASDAIRAAAPLILAEELMRIIGDPAFYNADGDFRPVELAVRADALRRGSQP